MGLWYDLNREPAWNHKYAWTVKELDGKKYMEQCIDPDSLPWDDSDTWPIMVSGGLTWQDYTATVKVRTLTGKYWAGIGFRYQTSRHYYLFAIEGGKKANLYYKDDDAYTIVASADFISDTDTTYTLSVKAEGCTAECSIDGKPVLTYNTLLLNNGKILLSAWDPARFTDVTLDMDEAKYPAVVAANRKERARLLDKQQNYPGMRLVKSVNFQNFGTARNIRFGDLTGGGTLNMLLMQTEETLANADETGIGCMTAIDFDGNILWQQGQPTPGEHILCKDLPCQIFDIDGDGKNEVIYIKDFKIIVANGATGKTKYTAPTPYAVYTEQFTIARNVSHKRIGGDCLRIVFADGKDKPASLLIKDRYNNMWLYDHKLNPRWHASLNTGHCPMPYDFGSGREDIIAGHSYVTADGAIKWSLKDMICHTDEIVIGKLNPKTNETLIAMASGDDGFLVANTDGKLLLKDPIGHAQRLSAGNYRPDLPGIELCVTTYWRNSAIITMYDCNLNRLFCKEHGANGNVIAPVNWLGDGSDLLLYSANPAFGGLYDGHGELVVPFPGTDNHPDLCCEAIDVYMDNRDELLTWDSNMMFIYTQEDAPKHGLTYAPKKFPHYNASNYRGEYHFPK